MNSTPNFRFAVATFDKKAVFHVLRVAWWLRDIDPLNGAVIADAAVSMAAVGYGLGLVTLPTATRIRLFAEAIGAHNADGSTKI